MKAKNDTWQIQGLTEFFDTIELPTELPSLKITDLRLFVSSHIATVTRYNGLETFEPHLNRLLHVKAILTNTEYVPNKIPCILPNNDHNSQSYQHRKC